MTDSITPPVEGHTPGPWHVAKNAMRRVTSSTGIVICNAVLRNCGTAKTGIKHGAKEVLEAEANARLIAAAPELLAALSSAVKWLAISDDPRCTKDLHAAEAAISKATGVHPHE